MERNREREGKRRKRSEKEGNGEESREEGKRGKRRGIPLITTLNCYMQFYRLENTAEFKRGSKDGTIAQERMKKTTHVNIIEICNNSDYDFKDS